MSWPGSVWATIRSPASVSCPNKHWSLSLKVGLSSIQFISYQIGSFYRFNRSSINKTNCLYLIFVFTQQILLSDLHNFNPTIPQVHHYDGYTSTLCIFAYLCLSLFFKHINSPKFILTLFFQTASEYLCEAVYCVLWMLSVQFYSQPNHKIWKVYKSIRDYEGTIQQTMISDFKYFYFYLVANDSGIFILILSMWGFNHNLWSSIAPKNVLSFTLLFSTLFLLNYKKDWPLKFFTVYTPLVVSRQKCIRN